MLGPSELTMIAKYFGSANSAMLLRAGALAAHNTLAAAALRGPAPAPTETEADLIERFFADKPRVASAVAPKK
ncbi:hypothetical protein MNEG_12346 [Monoraphidium neglectum]|uniref:Uncharacterized protein n=1 Tax=Monoraphidium neglectum TaxID=145388 RepID=A0A0D2M2Q3_9CHLO|nr:hypothetical protein MNEG_12346 [Monoraphidium neglectum]KIY95616.1 hypothetical protein MNEG_12346 [Monoraphidium neglectum]|eukprot:XP_013894636.1 hypothetical protein MNEG_12346 [Monoraphidium neglectum]